MGAGSSVGTAGNNLTLNLALTFSGTFTGTKNVYLLSQESNLIIDSGWVKEGTWTP